MAIVGITPTFMSPMAFRDSAQELAQQSREGAAALQNAFKFGTQVYDYTKNRQIGNALKKGDVEKAALLESQKINQQDPSVLWRWNQGQKMQQAQIDEAKAQREQDRQDAQTSIFNKTKATRDTPVDESNPDAILQQINNLNGHIAEMQNAKMDPKVIADVEKERDAWIGKLNTANNAVKAQLQENEKVKRSAGHLANIKELDSAGIEEYLTANQGQMNYADIKKALVIQDSKRRAEAQQVKTDTLNNINYGKAVKAANDENWANNFF